MRTPWVDDYLLPLISYNNDNRPVDEIQCIWNVSNVGEITEINLYFKKFSWKVAHLFDRGRSPSFPMMITTAVKIEIYIIGKMYVQT